MWARLERTAVADALTRLSSAYGRTEPKTDQVAIWHERLDVLHVTPQELRSAVDYCMERQERFPALSHILEAIGVVRVAEARRRDLNPSEEELAREHALHARIDEEDARDPRFGPVLLADGTPDPEWPELEGREPAWRRKALCAQGLWSKGEARNPIPRSKRGKRGMLDMDDTAPRGAGPQRMI